MSVTKQWHDAITEWHAMLVEVARVYSVAPFSRIAPEAIARAEMLSRLTKGFPPFAGTLPETSVAPPGNPKTAVADGLRAIDRLTAVYDRNTRLLRTHVEAMPTPGSVHSAVETRAWTRRLPTFRTRLESHVPMLHDRQFAARVPREYSLPLIENALTRRTAVAVMEGLTLLYEAGIPREYVSSAVDPAALDKGQAESVILSYRAGLPPEYAGVMT